jgi:two-component system, OmpR family, KDP operon response regulator KdpE
MDTSMQTSVAVAIDEQALASRRPSWPARARQKRAVTPLVLLVASDARLRAYFRGVLSDHRMRVIEAETGTQGLAQATEHNPDIVVLEFGLPDLNGIQMTMELRTWSEAPIFILSTQEEASQQITALDSGANEYLTRPFGTSELLARIRVWLKHRQLASGHSPGTVLDVGPLRIDFGRRQACVRGQEVQLTPRLYKLFETMMRNAGKALTHEQIATAVWGPANTTAMRHLRVYMGQLRRKLEVDPARPQYFLTEPGVGYRLRAEPFTLEQPHGHSPG